jgi:putative transposase
MQQQFATSLLRAHKIRLDPNREQAEHFAKACGVARFAWNWALAQWQSQYEAHRTDPSQPKPNEGALRRQLNAIKREQFPWMLEVTKCAPQESIIALGQAYKNWFASITGKRAGPRVRAPRFKRKGLNDRFKIHGEQISVDGCRIRIPNLGWVRMRETLRFSGRIMGATVSRTAHAWHVALLVEAEDPLLRCESQAAVGVDFGVTHLATLSTGHKESGPKALGQLQGRLRRLSRALSRKAKGSANRKKARERLARLHWRIANVRSNALHQLSHRLTRDFAWIAIEDLNVRGMLANGRLARHLSDASFAELRRQMAYKGQQRGGHLAVVDRWFASSKQCSVCSEIHQTLTLGTRVWVCAGCGAIHDRDVNAAKNLLQESLRNIAPGAGVSACGEDGSGRSRKTAVKPASAKQEATQA